jgi:hypothetical protein
MNPLKLAAFLLFAIIVWGQTTPTIPTFYDRRDYQEPGSAQTQVADINNDGIPDIIIDGSVSVVVMLGYGDGTFRSGISSKTPLFANAGFSLADLNGDGILDLVTAGSQFGGGGSIAGVAVYFGNGDGTFQAGTSYQIGPVSSDAVSIIDPVLGDFNGDGITDVVAVGQGGVWLLTGSGDGTLNPGVMTNPVSAQAFTLVSADLNGDKKLDLVITLNPGFVILFGNGNGTFQTPIAFPQGPSTRAIAIGSLTKGGPPSIVLFAPPTLFVYTGKWSRSVLRARTNRCAE